MDFFNVSTDGLFTVSSAQNADREGLAQSQLANGLDMYSAGQYEEAISTFRRAIALAPTSTTAIQAYDYTARSHLKLGDSEAAIDAYKKAIRIDPQLADTHIALGTLYITLDRVDEARQEYETAVKIDPGAANRFYLGQAYLAAGRYSEAEQQFRLVRELTPTKHSGDFGLGQVYAKQGKTSEAIKAFERAVTLKPDFWDGYAELAYALADAGEFTEAEAIADKLERESPSLATLVNQYIEQKRPPKMILAYSTSAFVATLGPGTQVSTLGTALTSANGQQTFSMVFSFDKEMDMDSVQSVWNWTIARSVGTGKGDGYNYDLPIPTSEVSLYPHPDAVVYDPDEMTATVYFTLHQNSSADGTLDPSHIKFTFNGQDMTGAAMDPEADEYMGFSGIG
jgi:tetratricopeptide (TPR) repeat protein